MGGFIELKVAEALAEDVGKGLARLDPQDINTSNALLGLPSHLRINPNFIHSSTNCNNGIVDFFTYSTGKGGEDLTQVELVINFINTLRNHETRFTNHRRRRGR